MSFDHLFWGVHMIPHASFMNSLEGFGNDYKIRNGESVKAEYPDDVTLTWNPDFPDHTIMTDCLNNISSEIIVSQRVQEFLAKRNLPDVEYLPVKVFNHKRRPLKTPYYVVHPTQVLDCLDLDACGITWDRRGTEAEEIEQFVVDPAKCHDLPPLFRLRPMQYYVVLSRELSEALDAFGVEGMGWVEPHKLADMWMLEPGLQYFEED